MERLLKLTAPKRFPFQRDFGYLGREMNKGSNRGWMDERRTGDG